MHIWRKILFHTSEFFYNNYPYVSICSSCMAMFTAYFHYSWKVHNYDLMYWKRMAEAWSLDTDTFQLLLILTILCINFVFISMVVAFYLRPLGDDEDMSLLQIKDRFARFILLRLIARMDHIQSKLANKRKALTIEHFVRAHHHMEKAVAVFRKDARKLILPNESEIMLPIQDIYGVAENEERALRRSGYYNIPIDITDEVVKRLFNAK